MIEVLEMDESKATPIFFTTSSPERGASKQEWEILARAIEYRWKTGNLCADDAVMDLHRAVLEIGEDLTLTEDEMDDLMHKIARMQMHIGCRRETYETIIHDTFRKIMEVLS